MIRFFLPLIILLSPTLFILWGAIVRVGLTWSLLLIPVGGIVGFVLMAIAGACFYDFMIKLEDRETGPPESGAIGAATGRAIVSFIWMILLGWIGSGLGAWLVTGYWVK
ncbi:hypothetical protein PCC9214_05584 [Planktothrix tepida]|uniref:Uncharacterized protein n=1 Tax=Planktothrix tepida PCC 9214 TaxID=671072 RepID=A0A1J1LTF6_9CYAN|nr:hypothetical protein [Planktothrix tepida]CAD5989496.1 hypothetical protein PCC9214_05584 [Planktothrix tepida]CUR35494.1 membrane hypothetical protein [Planktothrix tepida PCC 9214]